MFFYLSIAFIVFSIILTYKNLKNLSTCFLYGIILSWISSIISLVVYLSKHNYYFIIINDLFAINSGIWNKLILLNFNIDVLIRIFNGSVLLFYFFLLCFAIAFTQRRNHASARTYRIYFFLIIIPAIEFIFYDPYFQKILHFASIQFFGNNFDMYKSSINTMHIIFKLINYTYMLISFYLLIQYYRNYPKINFLKNYTLFNMLCLFPIALIHFFMFSWMPKILVRPTLIKEYYHYVLPDIKSYIMFFNIFPFIVFAISSFIVYLIFKYNSIETYYKNKSVIINKSIDTASLGVKTFAHTTKNHLVAIKSEAEFLEHKYRSDEETLYSLNLILQSCFKSIESIETISDRFRNINLNMQPTRLNSPVEKAASRLPPLKPNIQLDFSYCDDIPSAYIDEHYMSEAIYNILNNAVEEIGENNHGIIAIKIEEKNNWAIISISDNGTGIPYDHIEKIFSPFFSTKSSVNNWGTGLSYCHRIVTAHDGKISVESTNGKGTTFKIALPVI